MTKGLFLFAASTLLLGACSLSNQVASQKNYNDDVYYSNAKATEEREIVSAAPRQSSRYRSQQEEMYDNYGYNSPYYGQYYLSPRFSYLTPYNRFNPWYDYGYNSWYTPGISLYFGSDPWLYNNIYSYNYGYPYYGSLYGGSVLYNSYYPGYSYGSSAGLEYNDPNYRARPTLRGSENISGSVPGLVTVRRDAQGNILTTPSRGQIYQNNNPRTTNATSSARPARVQNNGNSQPQRVQQSPPPQQSQPAQTAPSSSGGGGGGGSDNSRARPSR